MAVVVYALFEDPRSAAAAEAQLRRTYTRGGTNVPHVFLRAPLEGNALPEGATEFGRNLAIAMAGGAAFMALLAVIAGALDVVPGMGVGMGLGLGSVTGALMGLVGAMQAGTRIARAPLRALEPRVSQGAALLVIELERSEDADRVLTDLETHGPVLSDRL